MANLAHLSFVVYVTAVILTIWLLGIILVHYYFPRIVLVLAGGLGGLVALGTSVYAIGVSGLHLGNGSCHGDELEGLCRRALRVGIGAGFVRLLVT